MPNDKRLVTLLTDFGLQDHYVAAMKGVMLNVNPDLAFVDISHMVPRHDIYRGAFTLAQACFYFPVGTIHLAVVDPGVGTSRKALAVMSGRHFFVAPDNGILTYIFSREDGGTAYEITEDHFFHKPVAETFHGRDIFAPVAAWISRDIPLHKFGPQLEKPVMLKIPTITRVPDALVEGIILAIDGFGNLITNLTREDVPAYSSSPGRSCRMVVGNREITRFRKAFGEGEPGELFVIPGSSGYLEIVMRNQSAAAELHVAPGTPVGVVFS
jgi:S-adenosylmethionine hydrolase